MLKSFVVTVLLVQFKGITSLTKTWKHNVNADNPENYEIGDDCRGFQFPKTFVDACMMSLGHIETNEIFLPINGDVVFRENASIAFKEQSKNCIKVKQPMYWHWTNPWAWSSILSDNRAVPHILHVPNICDQVIFPSDALYSVDLAQTVIIVSTIIVRGVSGWGRERKNRMYDLCPEFLGGDTLAPSILQFPHFDCGKYALPSVDLHEICGSFQPEPIKCSEPIPLFGHCQQFCGGVILIPAAKDEKHQRIPLENFMEESDNIDYYYMILEEGSVQIIFTDKHDFTGDSIMYTNNVYDALRSYFDVHNITNTTVLTSGMPLIGDKVARYAIGVIFGTLAFVVSIFVLLYAIYEGPFRHYTFSSRFNISRYNQALRRSVIFSRFDNREGVSIAGSVISLQKAFDNPMFGQPLPSTSYSNARDTVDDSAEEMHEEHCEKLEQDTEFKNPMFENTVETISDDVTIENLTASE